MTKTAATSVAPKGTRVTLAVDVSNAMKSEFIASLKGGWAAVNDTLGEDDMVSLSTFGVTTNTIFPYTGANTAIWDGKSSETAYAKLAHEIENQSRGYDTGLYDAIIKIVRECPRNLKYKKHRPEIIFFVVGADNSSKATLEELGQAIGNPRTTGLHITIIDASDGGNREMEEMIKAIPHADYFGCKCDKAGVKKAFEDATKAYKLRVRAAAAIGGGGKEPDAGDAADAKPDALAVKAKPSAAKGGKKKKGAEIAA